MTFQDLVDERGLDNVFSNTNVDVATQECILEWYFDFELADDDTSTWLRYFHRRLNDIYPKYMDLVRVMSAKSNMDPFIQKFMEKVHTSSDLVNENLLTNDHGTDGLTRLHTITDNKNRQETLNLRDNTQYNNVKDEHYRGVEGIKSTDTYNGYHEHNSYGSNGGSTDTTSGSPETWTDEVENSSKSRQISIAYPEANMGIIPSSIDGGTQDIAYASSEARGFSKDNLGKNHVHNVLDQKIVNVHNDGGSEDKYIYGSKSNTVTGTDTNTKSGSQDLFKTGTDTIVTTDRKEDSQTDRGNYNKNKVQVNEKNRNGQEADIEQGRYESPADLLPRAVKAIIGSDEVDYLITKLAVCFNCYSRI